ncbi:hypothetical protein AX15_007895 [Amanita polypyramis BW_CC]|nr:hypothetical protein AX15_007895 [Amanita polypyramis BW_CC]
MATHPEQEKGNRVLDIFFDRILFENYHHPKKGSKPFDQWLIGFNAFLDPFGWINNQEVVFNAFVVNAYASYDAELQAIESALAWAASMPNQLVSFCWWITTRRPKESGIPTLTSTRHESSDLGSQRRTIAKLLHHGPLPT